MTKPLIPTLLHVTRGGVTPTDPSISGIFRKLVETLNGAKLSNGDILTASDKLVDIRAVSSASSPYMMLQLGAGVNRRYESWTETHTLTVNATAKVAVAMEDSGSEQALLFVEDIHSAIASLRNLPVDEQGRVIPFTAANAATYPDFNLTELVDRGGLRIASFRCEYPPGSGYALVSFVMEIVTNVDYDPTTSVPMRTVAVGVGIATPEAPIGEMEFTEEETARTTLPVADTPALRVGEVPGILQSPPFPRRPSEERAGDDGSTTLATLNVSPYSAIVVATATVQLEAIGRFVDYSTVRLDDAATWTSSDTGIATVAAGLVTGVSLGQVTITASYNGLTSNAVTVVVQ